MEVLENIEVATYPHITDKNDREAVLKRWQDRISKEPPAPPKSAEEQYQAQILRMGAGG